ncbi:5-formyltetrahydrofolate cyclo-ligase [Sediminibacterium soli]|uniref:5-formyltetrahydrofolate cyclo-ligase n=1 Tax=Sediminibacterium soli TaxID=2698829 RepID=UPI00137A60CA|nr:5-formyltetrahydrofolate cyclo-ligase [Sediminibacterium soli]NCI46298.1 5-formyltetrahydrofolate cyclo-ligase [Sediminibacterium soli]
MTKQELRKQYRDKRMQVHDRERLRYDDLLLLRFQQMDYSDIRVLFTYWPMPATAEPNTHLFSGYLRHMVPGLQTVYPKINPGTATMEALLIDEDTVYVTNEWGITEPRSGMAVDPLEIDLAFVPMLVCDKNGQRVGYGKGFYDRYLARCSETVTTIGFSYFEPVDAISDTHQFDVPLHYCITPQQIYEF